MRNPTTRILVGDARDVLRGLPESSVHCAITSPPYWGLRAYGGDSGMIGLEATFDEHVENLVAVFREVRRVLRPDGCLFLNYGDAYAGGGRGGGGVGAMQQTNVGSLIGPWPAQAGLKPKDLMLMPFHVAVALQQDGWWIRSEIVWHKLNPMPESVTDRPTNAHEKVWLLSPSARYFYDADAVRTEQSEVSVARLGRARYGHVETPPGSGDHTGVVGRREPRKSDKQRGHSRRHAGFNDRWDAMSREEQQAGGANLRNVWEIATAPFSGSHFATFPPALVELCVKAGTSEKGCCSECGAPWRREVERVSRGVNPEAGRAQVAATGGAMSGGTEMSTLGGLQADRVLGGWSPGCSCSAGDAARCRVLDPFGGAGTVGLEANRLGRDAVLIEINAEYAEMARRRIWHDAPLFADVTIEAT